LILIIKAELGRKTSKTSTGTKRAAQGQAITRPKDRWKVIETKVAITRNSKLKEKYALTLYESW